MMFAISLRSVRHRPALFVGAFLALCLGTMLIAVTVIALSATSESAGPAGGPVITVTDGSGAQHTIARDAVDMGGIQTVLAIAALVSGFVSVLVVAGTFSFSVALRRRDLGLLRLVGAGARQIRRTVVGESIAVAVPAGLAGCALAVATAPAALRVLNHTGLTPVPLRAAAGPVPLAGALAAGLIIAVLGALASSRRAARVGPAEALREADIDAKVMTAPRWLSGGLLLAAGVLMVALAASAGAEAATPLAIFGGMALTAAATVLAPTYLPPLARITIGPAAALTTISGRLARAGAATSRRRTAALIAPVLAIVAIVGLLTTVLATTGAAVAADQQARNRGQLIVEPIADTGLDARALAGIAGTRHVSAVSAPAALPLVVVGAAGVDRQDAGVVDLPALAATTRLRVVDGALGPLSPTTIAISAEYAGWNGYRTGSEITLALFDGRTVTVTVASVIDGGAGTPTIMVAPALAGDQAAAPQQAVILLDDEVTPAAAAAQLTTATVRATPAAGWFAGSTSEQDRLNRLVLLVLTGPASVYALIAIANTLVMAISRRGPEFTTLRLLGVGRRQIRRMLLWESVALVSLGVVLAAGVIGGVLTAYRAALLQTYATVPVTLPWPALGGLVGGCLLVSIIASRLAANRLLHQPAVRMEK